MAYGTLTASSSPIAGSGSWLRLLLSGCAVLLALCSLRQAVAAAHYVQVRPTSATTASTSVWGSPTSTRSARPLKAPQTTAFGSRPTTAMRAADEVSNIPVLSITAIVLSLVAIVGVLLDRKQPAAPSFPALPPPRMPSLDENMDVIPMGAEQGQNLNNMDEVAQALQMNQARRKNLTPKQVILDLQRGNARFWSGTPERPEVNAMERRALIIAQAPTVAILSCADSRVPVEIVFDQGLGSLFVVRVAGNILDPTAMGSLEFSVKYLGVKAILVMGHEACGAVKGAMTMSKEDLQKQPDYLRQVLTDIKANLDVSQLGRIQDHRAQDREAVVVNTTAQVKRLQENTLIKERVENGSLMVCGAFYEITSGIVDFFTLDKNGLVIDV